MLRMQTIGIPGLAGNIEAIARPGATDRWAVLCHPHPLYGGSMNDAVLDAVEAALAPRGMGLLRFNFRGVGGSGGQFDHGEGEMEDLIAACRWLREEHGDPALWLAGYSFGAGVVWRAWPRIPNVRRLILIAPPTAMMQRPEAPKPPATTVLAGDEDPYVEPTMLQALPDVDLRCISGADHFFSGRWRELQEALAAL